MKNTISLATSLLLLFAWAGSAGDIDPPDKIVREDIKYATKHGAAIVEAEVAAGDRHAVGTRSEGYRYRFRVLSVLLPAAGNVSLTETFDYRKTALLRPGRYLLILQPGPYYRAERLSGNSARVAEVAQWTKHQ